MGDVGATARDNRRFVEAVLYRYRAGIPWRDLPERFGDGKNTNRRFSRWAKTGEWEVTKRQSAMISLRASATIMVLRVPRRLSAVRARYHNASALSF